MTFKSTAPASAGDISRWAFHTYWELQQSGETNMANVTAVVDATMLEPEIVLGIMAHYDELLQKYGAPANCICN